LLTQVGSNLGIIESTQDYMNIIAKDEKSGSTCSAFNSGSGLARLMPLVEVNQILSIAVSVQHPVVVVGILFQRDSDLMTTWFTLASCSGSGLVDLRPLLPQLTWSSFSLTHYNSVLTHLIPSRHRTGTIVNALYSGYCLSTRSL